MSDALDHLVRVLAAMSREQLSGLWSDLYKAAPPIAFTRDLLARGIAWRMQEKALGGLSAGARRVLDAGGGGGSTGRSVRKTLKPGNRLIRRWRGRTYVVEVIEDGLLYEGERFASLSVIAGRITGTRWSGPKFFGLVA